MTANRRLYRSQNDAILGGVAGGVADYLEMDPSLVRIVWAILAIVTGGIFVALYVVMWVVVPQAELPPGSAMPAAPATGEAGSGAAPASPAPAAASGYPHPHRRRGSGNGGLVFGLILIAIGGWFLVRQYVAIDLDRLWPVGLVLLGVLLLLVSLRRPSQ